MSVRRRVGEWWVRRGCLAALLWFAVWLPGCSFVLPFEDCNKSSDCPTGQVCTLDALCGPCQVDLECGGDALVCRSGECLRGCDDASECDDGQVCLEDGACGGCVADSECGEGALCLEGRCGEGCRGNGDCEGGQVCAEGVCGGCEEDGQCGAGQVCSSDGACAALLTPQCGETVGPFDEPSALRLGVLLSLSGRSAESGRNPLNAIKQAVAEINGQGGVGGLRNGPLAFLVCDDEGDEVKALAGVEHLAKVARVPAFIGPAQSRLVLAVADTVVAHDMVMMSPSATAVGISALEDRGLVWRTAPPDSFQANTLSFFAWWQVLERLAFNPLLTPRVTLVHSDDAYGVSFIEAFEAGLRSRADSAGVGLEIAPIPYRASDPVSVGDAAGVLLELEPVSDVVLVVGFEESADIMRAVRDAGTMQQSAFFMTDGTRSVSLRLIYQREEDKPALLFGSIPAARNSPIFARFASQYTARYGVASPPVWTEHAYDATYLLTYALSGTRGEASGPEVAGALRRLSDPGGVVVGVGPGDLFGAYTAMASGNSLDVEGASGPLDFDVDVGDLKTADILRWDVVPGAESFYECGVASRFNDDGTAERLWCGARCNNDPVPDDPDECVPDNAP